MMKKSRRERLVGVVTPLPTFVDSDHNLLPDRQRKHIRWLIDHGIKEGTGVLMGSAGLSEGYLMTEEEFQRIVDVLSDAARGEVPTMVGIFDMSCRIAARKAAYAAKAGIDFIQVAPPHYMLPSEDDVLGHYQYVNDRVDIGIMAYNTPWAMPKPGFDFSAKLLEQFTKLENVVGIKWASHDINHYMRMVRLFSDRLNFIDNLRVFSLGPRLGMKGFIEWWTNAAPRFSLAKWELLQAKKYDEYDQLVLRTQFDPFIKTIRPEEVSWVGMGEGGPARLTLRLLGLETGPPFPSQVLPSPSFVEAYQRAINASGILEWTDWNPSVFD
jgi:dihydrodipicolinate synthase/N-acetylneuraminate lyase